MQETQHDYPPSFSSIAKLKNKRINYQEEPNIIFVIFLISPDSNIHVYEPKPNDTLSSSIPFIVSRTRCRPEDIKFLTDSDKKEVDLSTEFCRYPSESVFLVSIKGEYAKNVTPAIFEIDQHKYDQLISMGFASDYCKKALWTTKNDLEGSINLLTSYAISLDEKEDLNLLVRVGPQITETQNEADKPTTTNTEHPSSTPSQQQTQPPLLPPLPPPSIPPPLQLPPLLQQQLAQPPTQASTQAPSTTNSDLITIPNSIPSDAENSGNTTSSAPPLPPPASPEGSTALNTNLTLYQIRKSLSLEERAVVQRLMSEFGMEEDVVIQLYLFNNKDETETRAVLSEMM
ncbi:hypothetical protein TRFO_10633 [Tritrichomonas foetus]|uniref:UBA domain-containing protein n=1 Tax=Tritrichomonas foetus TaxID=1144522 RepID=A0A1J4J7E8_9EUKA|nr:hypothetical protein TRFO_10633 [Tritrichomonas foetus]|eukprot:OHS95154.1 hypothetical protein TRFO_10633 [Tritrichomonas foetus]